MKDSDACLVRREVQLPKAKPRRNVVENHLDVSEFGFATCGGSAGDGGVDDCVICELGNWRVGGDGDSEIVDVDGEEEGAKNGSLRESIGHRELGAQTSLVLAGHCSPCEVVCQPKS